MKKSIAVLLVLSIVLIILAGCVSNQQESVNVPAPDAVKETATPTDTPMPTEEPDNGPGDIVHHQSFAPLSTAGWYRIIQYEALDAGDANGSFPFQIDIVINRGSYNDTETHRIILAVNWRHMEFLNEMSASNVMGIDKIRYVVTNGQYGYIDIHYDLNDSNVVSVDFLAHFAQGQDRFSSQPLEPVPEAPLGETVLVSHDFLTNTNATCTMEDLVFDRRGELVFLQCVPNASFDLSKVVIPADFRPKERTICPILYFSTNNCYESGILFLNPDGSMVATKNDGVTVLSETYFIINASYVC